MHICITQPQWVNSLALDTLYSSSRWISSKLCITGPLWRESTSDGGFPSQRANNAESAFISQHNQCRVNPIILKWKCLIFDKIFIISCTISWLLMQSVKKISSKWWHIHFSDLHLLISTIEVYTALSFYILNFLAETTRIYDFYHSSTLTWHR